MSKSRALPAGLIVVAVVCVGIAIFFATQKTGLLASSVGIHHKHAIVFGGLAVLALIAANIAHRRSAD